MSLSFKRKSATVRPAPTRPQASGSSSSSVPQGTTNDPSDDAEGVADGEEDEQPRAAASSAKPRGGTANDDASVATLMREIQRQNQRQLELLRQQMDEQRQQHLEAMQKQLDRVSALEAQAAAREVVLEVPRPTVATSATSDTTTQPERAPEPTSVAQKQPATPGPILATPARVSTPATRPALRPERPVLEDDDGSSSDGDNPQGPPANARGGQRASGAWVQQQPAVVMQRTAIPLPAVDQLRQADLVQNGRVLLKWKSQMQDQIEVAEFNDGNQPYEFARRFLMARLTMDEGVRDFITAYQNEAKAGRAAAIESWEQLITVLETHYAPARDAEEALSEFYKATMRAEESMDQFLHRIGAVVNRIPPKDMPAHTVSETVIRMVDERRFPELLRIIKEEQRKHKAAHDGYGMEFLTIRQRLPDLARDEPNRGFQLQIDALKAELQRQTKGGSSGVKAAKSGEKVNAVRSYTNFGAMSDEELKKHGWPEERIKAYRDGGCFKCFEKGHRASECPKKSTPKAKN